MTSIANKEHDVPQATALAVGTTHGQLCAIAVRAFAPGDVIVQLTGTVVAQPTRYSVQIAMGQHVDPPSGVDLPELIGEHAWRYMNHSCGPNAAFRGRVLHAVRAIAAGEEVRFHYAATEYAMAEPFACQCGASACVGQVQGYRYLSREQREHIAPYVQAHVLAAGALDHVNESGS